MGALSAHRAPKDRNSIPGASTSYLPENTRAFIHTVDLCPVCARFVRGFDRARVRERDGGVLRCGRQVHVPGRHRQRGVPDEILNRSRRSALPRSLTLSRQFDAGPLGLHADGPF